MICSTLAILGAEEADRVASFDACAPAPFWNDPASKGIGHGGKKECLYGPKAECAVAWAGPAARSG